MEGYSGPFLTLPSLTVLPVTAPLRPDSQSVPRPGPSDLHFWVCQEWHFLNLMVCPHPQARRRQAHIEWQFSQPLNKPIRSVPPASPAGSPSSSWPLVLQGQGHRLHSSDTPTVLKVLSANNGLLDILILILIWWEGLTKMSWERPGIAAVKMKSDWRCLVDCKLNMNQPCVMWVFSKKK